MDLVYLDPPFKSNQDYPGAPGLFAERDGTRAAAQIKAFEDTWRWDCAAAEAFHTVLEAGGRGRIFLGENPGAPGLAYLAHMAPRLVELRRVPKSAFIRWPEGFARPLPSQNGR